MKYLIFFLSLFTFISCNPKINLEEIEGKWSFYRYEFDDVLTESEIEKEYKEYIEYQNNNFEFTFLSNNNFKYNIYDNQVWIGKYKITKENNLIFNDTIENKNHEFKIIYLKKKLYAINKFG